MSQPKPMSTLSQVMAKLAKEKGIQREFRMSEEGKMRFQDTDHDNQPQDLKIVKNYRKIFYMDVNP